MFAVLLTALAAVCAVVLFLVLRNGQRKSGPETTKEKMQRLRTEECAQAVELGAANKEVQNRFRMDYWTMPMRQLSAFSHRSETERSAA
mmetsp:Transcript_4686/g.11191  ORF Transcript_4686/g.11191 Transcript_4686/m.11191 type:complete len:89 (-) Transcript_4686:135-401(-)|eukprot:CAMPEP_0181464148 /NCGR_PEP_ID=MMETSP1110-20121109/35279_1 /TAXON_ID=174948 /ORGANISM="Symbiodinium sp., Strain CCMP421" /LENGTH=88 /DNA_ID=CAMNT_0023588865 /DNA_START=63 /DNA_END=329 /DNA_ORIENTATION=-